LAGVVGGALSGTFLQTMAVTIVNGNGGQNPARLPEITALHALTGGVACGILMFAVGLAGSGPKDDNPIG